MPDYYIGLISGTSMDGIDAVVASFGDRTVQLHSSLSHPYPGDLRDDLLQAVSQSCSAAEVGALDRRVGECFREAAITVMATAGVDASDVAAIGSHGQTLRHEPDATSPYSLQIGDAATIAQGTTVTTIADFRRADIAAGGQGAPLVPPFHVTMR